MDSYDELILKERTISERLVKKANNKYLQIE